MTHEELIEKVSRAMCLANNHDPDAWVYDAWIDDVLSPDEVKRPDWTFYKEEATAAIATIREALSDPDNAQVNAFQDEYNTIARESGWVDRGTVPDDVSVKRLLVAALAASPLVAREERE